MTMENKNVNPKIIEEMKKHIPPLTNAISDAVIDYMRANFSGEVNADFILNLMSSCHMSSLSRLMRFVAENYPDLLQSVDERLDEIANALGVMRMNKDGTILN